MMNLENMSLTNLWLVASNYGRVLLTSNRDGSYFAQITFESSDYATMIVSSDYEQLSVERALSMAIEEARKMSLSLASLGLI